MRELPTGQHEALSIYRYVLKLLEDWPLALIMIAHRATPVRRALLSYWLSLLTNATAIRKEPRHLSSARRLHTGQRRNGSPDRGFTGDDDWLLPNMHRCRLPPSRVAINRLPTGQQVSGRCSYYAR